jgi:hypothetical protein
MELTNENKIELMALLLAKRWTSGRDINTASDIIKAEELLEKELDVI